MEWLKWDTLYFLSMFSLYRRLIGGTWYKVTSRHDIYGGYYWINRKPLNNEYVINVERW